MCWLCGLFFFLCKQNTAYELRIIDWSSDVRSSDLGAEDDPRDALGEPGIDGGEIADAAAELAGDVDRRQDRRDGRRVHRRAGEGAGEPDRSGERRVGNEWGSTCRTRWAPWTQNRSTSTLTQQHHKIQQHIKR